MCVEVWASTFQTTNGNVGRGNFGVTVQCQSEFPRPQAVEVRAMQQWLSWPQNSGQKFGACGVFRGAFETKIGRVIFGAQKSASLGDADFGKTWGRNGNMAEAMVLRGPVHRSSHLQSCLACTASEEGPVQEVRTRR